MLNSRLPDMTSLTRLAVPRSGHKISARQTMLLHQIGQQIGQRRRFARPARAFIRLDKASLRYHARSIGSLVRLHQLLGWYRPGEGAGLIGAVVGAIVVLFVYSLVADRRRAL